MHLDRAMLCGTDRVAVPFSGSLKYFCFLCLSLIVSTAKQAGAVASPAQCIALTCVMSEVDNMIARARPRRARDIRYSFLSSIT